MSLSSDGSELRRFKTDLHIHTCLSPCGDWEMSPKQIIDQCCENELDIIAVCDHNSAENVSPLMSLGGEQGIVVLPGMEVCSKEEVHMLTLFEELDHALTLQEYVYEHLQGENQPEVFGYQVIADKHDKVVGENPRMLIGATTLGLHEIVERVHSLDGLCIAAHIDRPAYGIINQLGFIPPDLKLDGVEVSFRVPLEKAREDRNMGGALTCVTSSDAHFLDDIGRASTPFLLAAPCFPEIRFALEGKEGRQVEV